MATELVKKFWKDDKLIIDPNHNSMVADHFIYPQSKNTTFLIPSLFTLRRENDSYIHSEHLEMHEKVQITMFNMWNNFNVTKVSEIAIFSNNDWGEEYYLSNNKKINTPTIGTKFSPEDYIKLIENFEEFMQVEIKKEESDLDYPVGKLESNDKKILVYFTGENDWNDAFKNWEERKKLLPKKSSILFKICDRKFKGELDVELLNKFDKIKLSKKVIFLSDFYKSKNKIPNKLDARFIPEKFSDNKNKCCPDGKKLYQICGIN